MTRADTKMPCIHVLVFILPSVPAIKVPRLDTNIKTAAEACASLL
jgi:hypothetical protein